MKHTKALGITLAVGIACSALVPIGGAVRANADGVDLANQSFIEFLQSDTDYEGDIRYTHTPLYNEDLQIHGREYIFSIGEVQGYALLAEVQGANKTFYEVEELFYNKQSPFDECEGLPVYITHGTYLDYKNNAFYDLADDTLVSQTELESLVYQGFGYCGTGTTTEVTQTVNYATKQTDSYAIQYNLPNYKGSLNGVTSCANNAGAILIGYYDRFYENLIPNFQSYTLIGNFVCYKSGGTEVCDLLMELYSLMGTDVGGAGTTYSGFQDGMQQYVTGKGYTYTTTNVFSNGSFNMSNYQNSVQNGKPVAMFLSGFAMYTGIVEGPPTDTIHSDYIDAGHVTIGCGYKIDTYYDANGQVVDTRQYLKVASGLYDYGIGYLNINALGIMDRAISVQIS